MLYIERVLDPLYKLNVTERISRLTFSHWVDRYLTEGEMRTYNTSQYLNLFHFLSRCNHWNLCDMCIHILSQYLGEPHCATIRAASLLGNVSATLCRSRHWNVACFSWQNSSNWMESICAQQFFLILPTNNNSSWDFGCNHHVSGWGLFGVTGSDNDFELIWSKHGFFSPCLLSSPTCFMKKKKLL